ncbi:MAG: carbohydrate ABC transporter permease [Firmicutes bacterium]|nr:carbohydrate ABC transporter permease [Bacillota bacterium]
MTMYAFTTSVKAFRHRHKLSFICYFTMVFQAGVLPWYLFCTRYYHIQNSYAGLILPYLMSPFLIVLLRTFYQEVPDEMQEAAKIDGANPFQAFVRIMLPLAKPGIATVTMYVALAYWNDMYLALYLMTKDSFYPLQYRLYSILSNVQFLVSSQAAGIGNRVKLPTETVKMALTCITIGPIIFLYPFVQKYFVKGVMAGAVKG